MTEAGIEGGIREIMEDRSRGASQLARRCLAILAQSAREAAAEDTAALLGVLSAQADMMMDARPSMAPVQNLLLRWKREIDPLGGGDLPALRRQAADIAGALSEASLEAVQAAAAHACSLVREGQTLITLSLSSTVLEVFRGLRGRGVAAIVPESRPAPRRRVGSARIGSDRFCQESGRDLCTELPCVLIRSQRTDAGPASTNN